MDQLAGRLASRCLSQDVSPLPRAVSDRLMSILRRTICRISDHRWGDWIYVRAALVLKVTKGMEKRALFLAALNAHYIYLRLASRRLIGNCVITYGW